MITWLKNLYLLEEPGPLVWNSTKQEAAQPIRKFYLHNQRELHVCLSYTWKCTYIQYMCMHACQAAMPWVWGLALLLVINVSNTTCNSHTTPGQDIEFQLMYREPSILYYLYNYKDRHLDSFHVTGIVGSLPGQIIQVVYLLIEAYLKLHQHVSTTKKLWTLCNKIMQH